MKTPPQQHFHASHLGGDDPAGPPGDGAGDLMALLTFPSSQLLLLKAEPGSGSESHPKPAALGAPFSTGMGKAKPSL